MKATKFSTIAILTIFLLSTTISCYEKVKSEKTESTETKVIDETPDYFLLRPELEKMYGYSHAVKIGNDIKISGAVSMDNEGNLIGAGSMEEQMKNCYSDLEKILKHYGYTFDDVIVENVFTTNMQEFINVSGFRNSIYKKQFPTGTWLEVKGLALPGQLIEIDMEAHKSEKQ
ncbi:RidA family protein [Yeosuana marina]|uniref:RidA family protein n=1 Tax=Yeosuana marina TaxID=1565536 RepID=UPI00141E6A0F|nr:RidA family protein [Yeosuana marina]